MKHYYSTAEAAAILKLPEHRLRYAHRANHVAKPETVIAGRQLYTLEDLKRLVEHFGCETQHAQSSRTE